VSDIAAAVDVLRRGGIVAYPTDTLYGLAVDPRRDDAVDRLFAAKDRPASLAVPLIAADAAQAFAWGDFPEDARRLADAFWPGPLSLVVPAADGLSRRVMAADGTVAIRVPAHGIGRALAAGLGCPITATSANLSGQPATAEPADVAASIGDRIDLLLDGGPSPGGPPSTIVACGPGGVRLVRAGAVAWERVLRSLE
jgi:L-threonylcarbamoyladenylate synthase